MYLINFFMEVSYSMQAAEHLEPKKIKEGWI